MIDCHKATCSYEVEEKGNMFFNIFYEQKAKISSNSLQKSSSSDGLCEKEHRPAQRHNFCFPSALKKNVYIYI